MIRAIELRLCSSLYPGTNFECAYLEKTPPSPKHAMTMKPLVPPLSKNRFRLALSSQKNPSPSQKSRGASYSPRLEMIKLPEERMSNPDFAPLVSKRASEHMFVRILRISGRKVCWMLLTAPRKRDRGKAPCQDASTEGMTETWFAAAAEGKAREKIKT